MLARHFGGKHPDFVLLTCSDSIAGRERIALIARITSAGWVVVLYRAGGMLTAHAGTRVNTFLVDTGKLSGAFLSIFRQFFITILLFLSPS